MSFNSSLYGNGNLYSTLLPNGRQLLLRVDYTGNEDTGIIALIVASSISALAVLGLLVVIAVSAFSTRKAASDARLFVRTHVAVYFVSLLVCDMLQAVGSLMNAKWMLERSVRFGTYCQLQGTIKQSSDVGQAVWTLIIAIHTFNVLFLRLTIPRTVMWATVFGGWAIVATVVLGGPATVHDGPFFGISGYWCWITEGYPVQRVTLDYLVMFSSAVLCFVLYSLVFLRLRGHFYFNHGHLRFRLRTSGQLGVSSREDDFARSIAKRMLSYPIAYTTLLVPIGVARFTSWAGHDVPFQWTIVSDVVFLLSGVVDVCLFFATRSLSPGGSPFGVSAPASEASSTSSLSAIKAYADLEMSSHPNAVSANSAPVIPARPRDFVLYDAHGV